MILGGAKVREILHALLPQCSSGVVVPRIVTKPEEDEVYLPPGSLSMEICPAPSGRASVAFE
jgi:hypothetical protein